MTENIANRIRKLLSLAQSTNPHEAAAAAAKAQELMIEYAIAESDLGPAQTDAQPIGREIMYSPPSKGAGLMNGKCPYYVKVLAQAVSHAMLCFSYQSRGHGIWVIGRADNRAAAMLTFQHLRHEIDRLGGVTFDRLPRWQQETTKPAAFLHAFRAGAADIIYERLEEARKQIERTRGPGAEMILRNQTELAQRWEETEHGVKFRTSAMRTNINSVGGYESGKAAGRVMDLSRRDPRRQIGS